MPYSFIHLSHLSLYRQLIRPLRILIHNSQKKEFPLGNKPEECDWWVGVTPQRIAEYVANGADVNARDGLGRTPAHHAAPYTDIEFCKALVAAGADLTLLCRRGDSPADLAYLFNDAEVFQFLVDNGAVTDEDLMIEKDLTL